MDGAPGGGGVCNLAGSGQLEQACQLFEAWRRRGRGSEGVQAHTMVGRKVVGTQSLRVVIEGPGGGAMDLQAFSTLRQRGVRGGGGGRQVPCRL